MVAEELHAILALGASVDPNATAIEDPERSVEVSYAGLLEFAGMVQARLEAVGVAPGDRVGILVPKSIASVTAIFGILQAGAAYVPADPYAPAQRCAFIFRDCSVRALIIARSLLPEFATAWGDDIPYASEDLGLLEQFGVDVVLLTFGVALGAGKAEQSRETARGDRLAYILYTSGSTGQPKGVVHTHASALSFVDWCSETFQPLASDRFSSHAPFHFDLSILDIYVPLKHGGTLVLIGEDLGKQPTRLAPLIAERGISVWYSTPSILRMLTEFGRMERNNYPALRLVLFAGEVFPVKHLRALRALWPEPRYFNLYGPTETNVCTFFEIPGSIREDQTQPFPIGSTCSNDRSRVVDGEDRNVTVGEEGELLIAGGSVMKEYWNLDSRTSAAFLVDSGERWYRTGDIVRDRGDGVFDFVGRRDRMVKRRGYRVELGEIESALYKHPAITEVAVLAVPDEESGVKVHAYLSGPEGPPPSLIEMKRFASQNLPNYMIPDRFSFLPSLPKTSTDKMDFEALKRLT